MALGAGRARIVKLIANQTLPLALAGIFCGLCGAAGSVRLMRTMLYEVDTLDPATFAAVAVLVLAVSTLAALAPARGATRVDPMITLRHE